MSTTALPRLAATAALATGALLLGGAPAHAQVAPDPYERKVAVVTIPDTITSVSGMQLGQIGLGAVGGLALGGALVVAARSNRRTRLARAA
jgi:hypothetical protein